MFVRGVLVGHRRTIGDSKTEFNRIVCTSKSEAAVTSNQQELNYRKQIARQLRTQFVESNSVTLKSTLRVTQGHGNGTIGQIIHDLLLDELLDVEYYRDLEMWVRGHSRSLKVVPFERLGMVSQLFLS